MHLFGEVGAPVWGSQCTYLGKSVHLFGEVGTPVREIRCTCLGKLCAPVWGSRCTCLGKLGAPIWGSPMHLYWGSSDYITGEATGTAPITSERYAAPVWGSRMSRVSREIEEIKE